MHTHPLAVYLVQSEIYPEKLAALDLELRSS